MLVAPGQANASGGTPFPTANWLTYQQAIYAVADSRGVPLLDIGARFGLWSAANSAGLINDGFHPSATGYADIGRGVSGLLAA